MLWITGSVFPNAGAVAPPQTCSRDALAGWQNVKNMKNK